MANADDGLFLPKRDIVSIDEARTEAEQKKARRPGDKLGDMVTRGWANETLSKLALELGAKMYEQVSGELADHLEEMERRMHHRMMREIEARSFMGRLRTFTTRVLIRLGATPQPPRLHVVDPVVALDPNVAAGAQDQGP